MVIPMRKGSHLTSEQKTKISASKKGQPSPFAGRQHTEHAKELIAAAQCGERNYQYGKHRPDWVKAKIAATIKAKTALRRAELATDARAPTEKAPKKRRPQCPANQTPDAENCPKNTVRLRSAEYRQKMSEIAKRGCYRPCFKGRKHTEEARKKQSEAHKKLGYTDGLRRGTEKMRQNPVPWTEERKHLFAEGQKGEKNPWWKGGATPANKLIRESQDFALWRKAVFQRDDWTCQQCGMRGGRLHPHHIKRFADYPELRFDISNGLTLCEDCHRTLHRETGGFSHRTATATMIGGTSD